MALEIRAIEPDELDEFVLADQRAFGIAPAPEKAPTSWTSGELTRTRAVFENGGIVAASRNFSFELTLPGRAIVPVGAVSWVSVQPTHRRRGILTQMMRALHDDSRERGEVASILTASEGGIYGRFGYGVASYRMGLSIDTPHVRVGDPLPDDGRMRLVARDEAEKVIPALYDEIRRMRSGMISRPDYWWPEVYFGNLEENKRTFFVVHEDAHGVPDGYADYEITGEWDAGFADRHMKAWDIQSADPHVRRLLWQYLLGVDLIGTVSATNASIDDPVRHLLSDPRRARVDYLYDGLWLAPLDAEALLASRRYSVFDGHLVVEVTDPDGASARYAIDGNDRDASCTRTDDPPDLSTTTSVLGAMLLGGNRFTEYAAGGLVIEHRPGALVYADAMFVTSPPPACATGF